MKLATLRDGSREGRLVVVSRDITRCSDARHVAPTLRAALDDWDRAASELALIARGLESGGQPVERFHERDARAPLPQAAEPEGADRTEPGNRHGGAEDAADPRSPLGIAGTGAATRVGAVVAVITGSVARGADRATGLEAVRLVMLGGVATSGAPAFSPVAATPDELGPAWDDGRLTGMLHLAVNGQVRDRTGQEAPDFGALIAQAARDAGLPAGTTLVCEPVARSGDLVPGDTIRIEMRDAGGHSLFGAIERRVERG